MRSLLLILIAFSLLLPVGWTDDYRQWDLPEGATMRLGKGSIIEIAYSPASKYLAVTSTIGIWLYDIQTLKEAKLLTAVENRISSRIFHRIAFSPDGKTLVSKVNYHSLHLWDLNSGKLQATIEGDEAQIDAYEFLPSGNSLITTDAQTRWLHKWSVETGKLLMKIKTRPD